MRIGNTFLMNYIKHLVLFLGLQPSGLEMSKKKLVIDLEYTNIKIQFLQYLPPSLLQSKVRNVSDSSCICSVVRNRNYNDKVVL